MQFELTEHPFNILDKIKYKKYQFFGTSKLTEHVRNKIFAQFIKIDGIRQNEYVWLFPDTTNPDIVETIIKNTCFVCGGLMKDGQALDNTYVSFNDFGNDSEQRGTTQSKVGPAKITNVRKCSNCGHSHT